MLSTDLVFALEQYLLLILIITGAYGLGRPLTGWMRGSLVLPRVLTIPLQVGAGIGVAMISLFVAGLLGQFRVHLIGTLLLIGLSFAFAPLLLRPSRLRVSAMRMARALKRIPISVWWWVAIALAVSFPLLLRPLQLPLEWDELMYHLPYARFWAQQGGLTVNEWLRYPLFPYNMDLLYGAALVFDNDVLPHLIHAFTGALTAVLTFAVATRFMDWRVGLVAAILLLHATRWGWSNAYIDLGLMLFWSCAFTALALRHQLGDRRFSYLAAFFAGVAVGVKYQGLFYLPVFVILALTVERRLAVINRALLIFLGVGGYWYLRNWFISGDPVHPIGGYLFGFWLWSPGDLAAQFYELETVREWPNWYFLPALGAAAFWRRSTAFYRGLLLCATASVVI